MPLADGSPVTMFFDIETTYLMVRTFRLGKQVIRHDQLVPGWDKYNVICIGYMFGHEKKVHILHWNPVTHDSKQMLIEFSEAIKKADIIIGKNSESFDIKHLNTLMMDHGLRPINWPTRDDLERQIRKYFYLPSYSLDYLTKFFTGEGKVEMKFQHWVDIQERTKDEEKSFKRMLFYCKKDVKDTKEDWEKVLPHIEPKFNMNAWKGVVCCKRCSSTDIFKNGSAISGKVKYEKFMCKSCMGYAGRRPAGSKPHVLLS